MIHAALSSSLSGLHAAGLRLSNSANNLASQHATDAIAPEVGQTASYVPAQLTSVAIRPTGGADAQSTTRDPTTTPLRNVDSKDPSLNKDTADHLIDAKLATYSFKGNLKIMDAHNDMIGSLLDIAV